MAPASFTAPAEIAPSCAAPRGLPARAWSALLVFLTLLGSLGAPRAARALEPDYSSYEAFLKRYIHVLGGNKKEPLDTRFDYEQLYIDEDIKRQGRSDRLTTVHTQLLSVSPATMTDRERLAWALNAYNFLTIENMTLNLLVPNTRSQRYDSPKQVRTDRGIFFGCPVATLEGVTYSLTGFERRFIYGDTATNPQADGYQPRETPGDPRLQFALCKAALCTGLILPWAYRADSLEAQLDRAARLSLAHPRWIKLDKESGTFNASNRFFDERPDFGGPHMPGLMAFLQKYGTSELQKTIRSKKLTQPSMFFEPSWKLNQYDHPATVLPGEKRDSTGTR
jgi:hypothetical protein